MLFDYHSKRWKLKRKQILKRDGWMCRERKRYGKRVEATTVHHIYPAEQFPEYAYCDWNLIALSETAHDEMHDRTTGKLTAKGKAWQQRVEPLRRAAIPPPC